MGDANSGALLLMNNPSLSSLMTPSAESAVGTTDARSQTSQDKELGEKGKRGRCGL